MNKNYTMTLRFLLGLALGLLPFFATASEVKLDESPIPSDFSAIHRGGVEVMTVCAGCHGLKYIRYRDLLTLGFTKDEVDGWRGANPLDTPLPPQMPAEAAKASFGVEPPDLSLMAAAREGGGHYIYTYLTGYHMVDGKLTNSVFPVTRMPDILGLSTITDAKQRIAVEKTAKDVSAFLVWASDPHAQERKTMGYYVLIYIVILTTLFYFMKKKIWRNIDRQPKI